MKILFRVIKEAKKYQHLLIIAIISTLMLTGINLIAPKIMSEMTGIVASGVDKEALDVIIRLSITLLLVYFSKIIFRFLSSFMSHKAAWILVKELQLKVYDKLQRLSLDFFSKNESGDLVSRTLNDTRSFELLYAHLIPETISNAITLVGVTIILFNINAKLALLTCIPIPFILLSGWFFVKKVRPKFKTMHKYIGKLSAQLQDNYSGIKEIQSFGQQERAFNKVEEKADVVMTSTIKALRMSAVFHPTVEFFTALGMVAVVGFGGYFAYQNQINVEDIVAFFLYLSLFYAPITGLAQLLESLGQALAAVERVIEIIDAPNTIIDKPNAKEVNLKNGHIKFNEVSFYYTPDKDILKNVTLEIKPGQMAAIVGATGVGKSTLVNLLSRFYDPISGEILIDENNIADIKLVSLRKNIAMVMQDTFLFNSTVRENIAFAAPNMADDEVINAAKAAKIHDDIMMMTDGYETKIGERGTKLSGGQKQRIAIARAILCNSPILVLDEATASVDVQTESNIKNAIAELHGKRTIIAIAHRLSTIKKADIIYMFKDGEIAEQGTHDELIALNGLYTKMCKVQEDGSIIKA